MADDSEGKSWNPFVLSVLGLYAGYHYFQRRPRRIIPPSPGLIVSPANGKVIHIERTDSQHIAFFKNDVLNVLSLSEMQPPFQVVVIELSLFDVHVQRAPITGQVVAQRYFPGGFANALYSQDAIHLVNANEKQLTIIANEQTAVGVIQVAGIAARRIVAEVTTGQLLAKGAAIGHITFGSQVVLVLRDHAAVSVQVGDVVTDGETIIAQLPQ